MPVHTDLPPAPDYLLWVVRCNCQTDCSTLRCTLQETQCEMLPSLWQLQGICMNSERHNEEVDDEDNCINGGGTHSAHAPPTQFN